MSWDEVGKEGIAYLIALDPLIDEKGEAYIPLMYTFPLGKGMKVSQNSVLVRPFYNVLDLGKPMGMISYIFYQEKEDYFILGSFVYTKRRILFFPGSIDRRLIVSSGHGNLSEKNQMVDHYSLESDLSTYHLTLENKKIDNSKYPRMSTMRVKDDMFLWLFFGVKSAEMLEAAPNTQEIRLKGYNQADLERRYKLIEDARGNCIFNVVKVKQQPDSDFYVNIEIFVSNKQSRDYLPPDFIYHVGLSSYATWTKEDRKEIPIRLHHVILKGFSGSIWIRVSKLESFVNKRSTGINLGF